MAMRGFLMAVSSWRYRLQCIVIVGGVFFAFVVLTGRPQTAEITHCAFINIPSKP